MDEVEPVEKLFQDAKLPPQLENYLYDFLDGKVRSKRGPKPNLKSLDSFFASQLSLIYHTCKMVLDGNPEAPKELGGLGAVITEHDQNFDKSFSNYEKAAMLTSIWFYGHSGHHRTIMNRISSHNKPRNGVRAIPKK